MTKEEKKNAHLKTTINILREGEKKEEKE